MIRLAVLALAASLGASAQVPAPQVDAVRFEEPATRGLNFSTDTNPTPKKYQPQTMLGGIGLFDYNNDGLLDIFVVNGANVLTQIKDKDAYSDRLFRNNGDGSFTDVTRQAGVGGHGYNFGVAIADYDNDGFEDLFVAGLRGNILYHNNGDGTFTDVTAKAGLAHADPDFGTLWGVSAAWVDYDRDGYVDLFVSNYCVWDPTTEPVCGVGGQADFCHPRLYKGLPNSLFHNNRDGTFTDVSATSGIRKSVGKGMGVAVADFDDDGWPDLFVANDTMPSSLFHNNGDGTFSEIGLLAGVAYPETGNAVSGMGAVARDIDNDGWPDIFETAIETMPLFRNLGKGRFLDSTYASGLGRATLPRSGWSNGIADFNNDGKKDLFAACGGVMDERGAEHASVPQTNALYLNLGNRKFTDRSTESGLSRKAVFRGAAFGDFDNDGRIDVAVTELNGPLRLLHNASPGSAHWLTVKTVGTKSNRDGIGARIRISSASGTQYNDVAPAVGYACSSDRRVHFGLGKDTVVQELQILWPSGTTQSLHNVKADQILTVEEPRP